jgi:hypothetical protein
VVIVLAFVAQNVDAVQVVVKKQKIQPVRFVESTLLKVVTLVKDAVLIFS